MNSISHTCGPLLSHLASAKLQSKMGNTPQALNELQDVLRRAKKVHLFHILFIILWYLIIYLKRFLRMPMIKCCWQKLTFWWASG